MKYEAVIFDLDGTLLDTLEDLKNAVNAALRGQRLPERTLEEVRQFVGNGIVRLMERASGWKRENESFDDMMKDFRSFYGEHCEDNTMPYEGIIEMLDRLKSKKIKMAVVSNKADFAVQELIPGYFGDRIDIAHGENEEAGICKKPAPDMVLETLRELGCPKERTVYVGDSDVDFETAKNSALDFIGVSWGFRGRKFLEEKGAENVIDRPEELFSYIE